MPRFHCRVRNGSDRKGAASRLVFGTPTEESREGGQNGYGKVRVTPTFGGGNATRSAPLRSGPFRTLQWKRAIKAPSALDPLPRGHSQATIQLKSFKEGESIVDWWGHVFDKPDKYPSLSAMVKCFLSIFHGPRVESTFSLMNDVIDQRSGNMNVQTFNAIQTVKYTLQSKGKTALQLFRREDVKFGEVDRTLCKNINSAAATYKRQQKKNQKEKQQQQSKYSSQASGSARQANK
ncbi:unnamed protein product [Boreogadus saida]